MKKNVSIKNWATQTADDILANKIPLTTKQDDDNVDKSIDNDLKDIENKSLDEGASKDLNFGGQQQNAETTDDKEPNDWFFDMGQVTMLNATTIYFNCYVEKYTVDEAIALLKNVNRHIATVEVEYPELKDQLKPKFIINSGGGSVVQGLRLFDRLKNNIYPVSTIVDGMAASMGIILAVSGAKKQATPNSVLMIHSLSAGAQGKFRELMDYAVYWTKLQTKLSDILKNNTKADKAAIDEFMKGESYLLAEEALKIGIIDEIVHL